MERFLLYQTAVFNLMANITVMKCPICSSEMASVAYEQRAESEIVSYIMENGDWFHGKVQRYICKECLCIQTFLAPE
jgi:transposase-like protein